MNNFNSDNNPQASKKRIFIGLLGMTFALIMLLILAGGWIATIGLNHLHPSLTPIAKIVAGVTFVVLSGIISALIFSILL
ncbi:hypothetical protein KAI46_00615, partial [bacterium]|nr:hypothetical protein [bacterium]